MPACFYHPDRAGIGICIRCRRVICAVCSTRLEGVNHCPTCLRGLGATAEKTGPTKTAMDASFVVGMLLTSLAGIFLTLLVWWAQGVLAQ